MFLNPSFNSMGYHPSRPLWKILKSSLLWSGLSQCAVTMSRGRKYFFSVCGCISCFDVIKKKKKEKRIKEEINTVSLNSASNWLCFFIFPLFFSEKIEKIQNQFSRSKDCAFQKRISEIFYHSTIVNYLFFDSALLRFIEGQNAFHQRNENRQFCDENIHRL